MRLRETTSWIVLAGLVAGCSSPADAPLADEEPQLFDAVFSEGDLVLGPTFVVCESWDSEELPGGSFVYLDLMFGSPGDPEGPSPETVSWIRDQGAEVLHEFNINAVRARIPRDRLNRFTWPAVSHARGVVDLARRDLETRAFFAGSRTEEDVRSLLEDVGGTVVGKTEVLSGEDQIEFHTIVVPDARIPDLRERAGRNLRRLEQPGFGCFD